jgi:hypothetical protein
MRLLTFALAAAALAGCGHDRATPAATRSPGATPHPVAATSPPSPGTVTVAKAGLSVQTHKGTDDLSGLVVSGTCEGAAPITIEVGHAAPYTSLRTRCHSKRFTIRRSNLRVPFGERPLTAAPRGNPKAGRRVKVKTFGIE